MMDFDHKRLIFSFIFPLLGKNLFLIYNLSRLFSPRGELNAIWMQKIPSPSRSLSFDTFFHIIFYTPRSRSISIKLRIRLDGLKNEVKMSANNFGTHRKDEIHNKCSLKNYNSDQSNHKLRGFCDHVIKSCVIDFVCNFLSLKLRCDERFTHAFTACSCVFKENTLVGSNQGNYFENKNACSKRTLKTIVATQLKLQRFFYLSGNYVCQALGAI